MTDLDKLDALLKAATPGPIRKCSANDGRCSCGLIWSGDGRCVVAVAHGPHSIETVGDPAPVHAQMVANMDALVEAFNAAPALIAELREARAEAARLREALEFYADRDNWKCPDYSGVSDMFEPHDWKTGDDEMKHGERARLALSPPAATKDGGA